jgi:hypothetical protein
MTNFSITSAVALGMMNGTGLAASVSTSPLIRVYGGTPPTNADASLSSNTQLAQLACASTPFSGFTDTGSSARATFGAIADDSSADNTGVATFFRLLKSDGTTVIAQGDVNTSGADLQLNTTSITADSTVSITSATIDLPKGP